MASSKKWATVVSSVASITYFVVIIFQVPIFRVPCRSGICTTPIEVTCSQLIDCELFPIFVVKALLYPGAVAIGFLRYKAIPSYRNLLTLYNFNNIIKAGYAASDLHHLEVTAGSYLCVAGAIFGPVKPGRISLFGTLLVVWGLTKDAGIGKSFELNNGESIDIYPTMLIAITSAFLSIRRDVRKIIRSFRIRHIVKNNVLEAKRFLVRELERFYHSHQ